jgi:hypothetical protein
MLSIATARCPPTVICCEGPKKLMTALRVGAGTFFHRGFVLSMRTLVHKIVVVVQQENENTH